jgi:hypothetical protein
VSGRHVKGKSLLKDKDCIQIHDREFYFHARAQIEQSVSKVATLCCARIDSTILSQSAEVCVCVCMCVCVRLCVCGVCVCLCVCGVCVCVCVCVCLMCVWGAGQ